MNLICDKPEKADFDTMGYKIKATVTGDQSWLNLAAVSGWANGIAKVDGDKLIESVTHCESNTTVTSTWERAWNTVETSYQ